MKTLHGTFRKVGGETYLLTWVSPQIAQAVNSREARFDELRHATNYIVLAATHLGKHWPTNASDWHGIVITTYLEVARSIDDAFVMLKSGSLADSLTLIRPVIEYLLDVSFLKFYPGEVSSYEKKAREHNAELTKGLDAPRDSNRRMRFKNISTMNERILKHTDCTDIQRGMVEQYNLLSNVADHTSPERKNLLLNRRQDWENAIGQLERATFYVVEQISTIDPMLYGIIEQDEELSSGLKVFRARMY